jgi:fructokinase
MIVVAGEALVDLIPTGTGDLGVNPGGGPFNTARWLGRLGADVGFLGTIAADPLGQQLRDQLVTAGVKLDLVVATELPTTLALAQLDAAGAAQYSFYVSGTSISDLRVEQVVLPEEGLEALYVGSLGLVLEPIGDAVVRAVELARGRGAVVMLDPNVRAALIADRAAYMARFDAVLAQTDVLKLSVDDLDWLAPGESALVAARALLERGPRVVLLTAGSEGATVLTAEGVETSVAAVAVDVVDTIGAGDAFSAGFLSRWLERGKRNTSWGRILLPASRARRESEAIIEAARFATQVAGLACSGRGATPPADTQARLERAGAR